MPRQRTDRFLEHRLSELAAWLHENDWRGNEHDCVNLFVQGILLPAVEPGAAIEHPGQIGIESSVRQPKGH